MTNSILVLGLGELGTAVLDALTSHPSQSEDIKISVLLRPSSITSSDATKQAQNARLKSLGIELVGGDIDAQSVDELAALFGGYHTVISCTGMYAPRGTQLKLSRAVLQAGVARYFPWQFGLDYDVVGAGSAQDLFDEQLGVRGLLRAQTATDWVIVSTGLFMSFLFEAGFGPVDLKNRTLRALGSWDTAVTITTPRDIGRVVAEVVYESRGIERQVVYVAGDTVTYGRVAELVEARFGGEWKKEVWGRDELGRRLEEKPDDMMAKYQNVFAGGKGVAWGLDKTVNAQRGMVLEDLESYLKRMDLGA